MFKLALLIVLYTKQIDLSEINDLNGINQNVRKPKILNRDESTENFSKETFDEEVIKNISAFLKEFKQPCILLVDEYKHENTLIQNLLEENNEFRLMKFNDTGITSILIKLKNEISQQLKLNKTNIGSVACFGILQTVRILPAGGTILVFIDRKTQHENLANLAVKELLENHIKLFVIWEGSDSTTTNGDILLEQAAVLSGGLFFARKLNNQKSLIIYRKNGLQPLSFPMDAKIFFFYITNANTAMLYTGKGYLIDLLDDNDVNKFSVESQSFEYNIYLVTRNRATTPTAGIWRLDVNFDKAHGRNVTISVQNDLKLYTQLVDNYKKGKGNEIVRTAKYEAENINALPTVTIDVGSNSELLVTPNKYTNIFFEVTNNGQQTIAVDFSCRDEKFLLQWMTPRGANINPKQTIIVTVNIHALLLSGSSYTDTITLIVKGNARAEKSTLLYINSEKPSDTENPNLWYKYTSDCLNVATTNCEDASWTIEATAQDTGTGLLSLTTIPLGIYFPNTFISGTKDQVTGYYSDSCCNPQLQLQAVDFNNNKQILTVDALNNASLSAGIIGAIVLAVFLFIALIVIIVLIVIYRKKRNISIDLPMYRGPSGSKTNK